jgi:signal transduction histidine kinase
VTDAASEAAALLARHRLFGLTWLDADLVALRGYGDLAAFVPIGRRITDTVLPLLGLDDALLALKLAPDAPFEMPNVSFPERDGPSPRLNLLVYWLPERRQFLLVVSKVHSTGDLEIGLAQQVRARMIAEAELARKSRALEAVNAELTRANRDLAEFAYLISHDLKAPLRAMRYFADDLERSLSDPAVGAPRELATLIKAQSRRMTQMLTDLLAYSRIGRQGEALDIVDTGALVRGIAASMPRCNEIAIDIAGDWPALETYAAPLDLVLRNLITNAINHHDRPGGRVQVSCRPDGDMLEMTITDDGPGIAPEWHEAIFQPFRTIAAPGNPQSSGIGLALVRRTVETVGAKLRLESDPAIARGCRFTLKWPRVTKA